MIPEPHHDAPQDDHTTPRSEAAVVEVEARRKPRPQVELHHLPPFEARVPFSRPRPVSQDAGRS